MFHEIPKIDIYEPPDSFIKPLAALDIGETNGLCVFCADIFDNGICIGCYGVGPTNQGGCIACGLPPQG